MNKTQNTRCLDKKEVIVRIALLISHTLYNLLFHLFFFLIDSKFLGVVVMKQHIQMAHSKDFS